MSRKEKALTFRVRNETTNRTVTVKAYDTVGPEDAYNILFLGSLHRIATGEDLVEPVAREIKDWFIRTSLYV